jgi:hypothetical protein
MNDDGSRTSRSICCVMVCGGCWRYCTECTAGCWMYCTVPGRGITVVRCSGSAVTVVGCTTVRVVTGVCCPMLFSIFPKPALPGKRLKDGEWGERVGKSRMKLLLAHWEQGVAEPPSDGNSLKNVLRGTIEVWSRKITGSNKQNVAKIFTQNKTRTNLRQRFRGNPGAWRNPRWTKKWCALFCMETIFTSRKRYR